MRGWHSYPGGDEVERAVSGNTVDHLAIRAAYNKKSTGENGHHERDTQNIARDNLILFHLYYTLYTFHKL